MTSEEREEKLKKIEELDAEIKRLYRMKEELIMHQKQFELWCIAEERKLALLHLGPPIFPGYYPYSIFPPNLW
jgi:hypothetical protein